MSVYVGEEEVIRKNMALEKERTYTTEYVEALPEGVRAELIDGQLFYMATPTSVHQGLLGFLHGTVWSFIQANGGECQVYPAPLAVYLNRDNKTYLEPDIMIVCDRDKMKEKGCFGAPDFVAEIVSSSTRSRDYLLKLNQYRTAGVREYWILDPIKERIQVYDFVSGKKECYGFEDSVKMEVIQGLEVDFSKFRLKFG